MVKEHDPEGERTVGVITKCDVDMGDVKMDKQRKEKVCLKSIGGL